MTLIEAIKSGKRFRINDGCWCFVSGDGSRRYLFNDHGKIDDITVEDLLSSDWVVEEKILEFTEDQLDRAFYIAYRKTNFDDVEIFKEFKARVKKELGL